MDFGILSRRLTQLYSDTKTSCDAVTEPATSATQPELNALNRKFRIQKDRLLAWGFEWSDSSKGKQEEVVENVVRAGMTSNVANVMGTIKDILDEAERMHPSMDSLGPKTLADEKGGRPSDAIPWAASDLSRYEDLAKELTMSVDTLYDLSRARRSHREGARIPTLPIDKTVVEPPKPAKPFFSTDYNASDVTLINPATLPAIPASGNISFRTGLPPKLDPSDLVLPQEEPPPYESVGVSSSIRLIGRLRSRITSTSPWKTDGGKTVESPVLVEYANFDSTYRLTGVSPPNDRLDHLLDILTRLGNEQAAYGTLTCLGYFEDPKQPRFGLVYELPSFVYSGPTDSDKSLEELRPVSLLSVLQTGSKAQHNSNSSTPPLEDRFRLAFTLATTFSKIHGDNFAHKDVNSSSVIVFRNSKRQSANNRALQYALRSPVVCSYDLFSEYDIEPARTMSTPNFYRHPKDPKFTGDKSKQYGLQFDLYGLGLILLEIGLWLPLSDLWKAKYTLDDFKQRIEEVYIRRLASKCGTAYMQVVRDCFSAAESAADSTQSVPQMYNRILIRLQRCCALDEQDTSFAWGDLTSGIVAPIAGSSPLKRKSIDPAQATDMPSSPSQYRKSKRWLEKGSQILERSISQTKPSPKSSPNLSGLTRNGSKSSQHSARKSFTQSLHSLISPREDSQPIDWQASRRTMSLDESGTLIPSTNATTPTLPDDKGDMSALYREDTRLRGKDYKEKITVIQRHWRQRKQRRTIQALVASSTRYWPQSTLGYPTPEPELSEMASTEQSSEHYETSSIRIERPVEAPTKPKLRMHPLQFSMEILNDWNTTKLPRLERLLARALKDKDETVSIDLLAIGETKETAKPTIIVTCDSTARVRALLAKRFTYEEDKFDLKVRRGKIRRSKLSNSSRKNLPHRSMMNTDVYGGDMPVMNPFHQERPLCGASIGAYRDEHLPPVSFGGVILVDDEPLGMSVHHLLDAPSEDDDSEFGDEPAGPGANDATLSSANNSSNPWLMGMGAQPGVQGVGDEPMGWDLQISDDEDMSFDEEFEDDALGFSGDDSDLDFSDDESENNDLADSMTSRATTGDIEGITAGRGKSIRVTQPALDDVADDFFPCEDDKDEDHLDSHELGYVHASSGIRRWKRNDIVHEIDWALLKINPERLQPYNLVQGGRRYCIGPNAEADQALIRTKLEEPVNRRSYRPEEDEYPNEIANADRLGGVSVHCFGRTSGLQGGIVGAAMSSVRIYRRKTFSRSWHVLGGFGMGGDSGAWVIQNSTHKVCGHVLAWCERNHLAYICPMEVLIEDIKRTLGAKRVYLPGSAAEASFHELSRNAKSIMSRDVSVTEVSDIADLETGVEGLGIVDSTVGTSRAAPGARRSHLGLPPIVTNNDNERENLPVLRSRVMRVKESRTSPQLEVMGSPVEVGGHGRGMPVVA